jgi:hypothetical protein
VILASQAPIGGSYDLWLGVGADLEYLVVVFHGALILLAGARVSKGRKQAGRLGEDA